MVTRRQTLTPVGLVSRAFLNKAARKMKFAKRNGRVVEFELGDHVLIKLGTRQLKKL